ncbi:MAG: copper transporter [Solirubrobacteraceae bacterium]
MFDFRYHALSLAAVFIALVVGLLLGVAIGDKELVSSARTDIRNSLRNEVRRADSERDAAKAQLASEQRFGDKAYPILTGGRLRGRRIGLVMLGPSDIKPDRVREWLDPSGASLALVAELRDEVDPRALAARASGTRYASLDTDSDLLGPLGRRVGIQLVEGGRLVDRLRSTLLQTISGEFGGLDGVIVIRPSQLPEDKAAADRLKALQDGITRGLAQTGVKVVGIEPSGSEPSQIGWYRERELSTVDNVDENAGRAALVFVLAGADGAFGRRDSAQDLLPPVIATTPRRP